MEGICYSVRFLPNILIFANCVNSQKINNSKQIGWMLDNKICKLTIYAVEIICNVNICGIKYTLYKYACM